MDVGCQNMRSNHEVWLKKNVKNEFFKKSKVNFARETSSQENNSQKDIQWLKLSINHSKDV